MLCFCRKLSTNEYHNLTFSEIEVLKRLATEAPHLFSSTQTSFPAATPPDLQQSTLRTKTKRATSTASRARKLPRVISGSSFNESDPNATSSPLSVAAVQLVNAFSYINAGRALGEHGYSLDLQLGSEPKRTSVKIFLAVERSNSKIEIQQLCRRIFCYAFAQLYPKGTCKDRIVQEIENAVPSCQNTREKVYRILRIGTKWRSIVGLFKSITGDSLSHTGLLCLASASTWEKAPPEACRSALNHLSKNTDIYEKSKQFTPSVDDVLKGVLFEHCFVSETQTHASQSPSNVDDMITTTSSHSCSFESTGSGTCVIPNPPWMMLSLAALSKVTPELSCSISEDASILLIILSCLKSSERIPISLLLRGATSRRRWTLDGEMKDMDATRQGLVAGICGLLSSTERLSKAFECLENRAAVYKNPDQTYCLTNMVSDRVLGALSVEQLHLWRCQVLIVTYRAIPWKYIESTSPDMRLFLPHLQHALLELGDRLTDLCVSTRADLGITLIEGIRFPNMSWKKFAINQAEVAAHGIDDGYLRSCLLLGQCSLSRISGNTAHAVSCVADIPQDDLRDSTDKRRHYTNGQAAIQGSLNCLQVEDLSTAKDLLGNHLSPDFRSSIEDVVVFRKAMLLGRILRLQGEFQEALVHLLRAHKLASEHMKLNFDEDLRDLTCDLADTLRELDDPVSAERYLRLEISRQSRTNASYSGRSLLELSLAEALFAQQRFADAKALCADIQSRSDLLKLEWLRLHITEAKLRHIEGDHEGALSYWSAAMKSIGKFPMKNGRATRILVLSICDNLGALGQTWLMRNSMEEVASIDKLAKPGGAHHWVAGLGKWLDYLQTHGLRSRM